MSPRPPRLAAWLMARLTPDADTDVVLGDLAEGFQTRLMRDGHASARRWYTQQVTRSLLPTLSRRWHPGGFPMRGLFDGLWQDIQLSGRQCRRRPLVSGVALLSLIVGLSLTAVVYSLMTAALLRPLAAHDPSSLSWITQQRQTNVNFNLPYLDYLDWRSGQSAFTDLLASARGQMNLRHAGHTALIDGEFVSGSYFPTLQIPMLDGRALADRDDTEGTTAVLVSRHLWRELVPGDGPFAPLSITINEVPMTVVGVVSDRFTGLAVGMRTDVWVPLARQPDIANAPAASMLHERRVSWLTVFGRRKPGVSEAAAQADLNRVEAGVAAAVGRPTPKQLRVTSGTRGATNATTELAPTLRVIFAASVVVLIVACANVTNLLMARGAERRRELSVRTALGAGRFRLVRLFLIEAGLIHSTGAVVSLGLALLGARLAAPMLMSFGDPLALDVSLDWRVTGFVVGLGLVATLAAGMIPAISAIRDASRPDDASRSATMGRRALRLRQTLLVLQFACSLALIVAAALLLRTVNNLSNTSTGFATDRVALITVSPRAAGMTAPQTVDYIRTVADKLRNIPGVDSVGFARVAPVAFGGSRTSLAIPGATAEPQQTDEINFNGVMGGYFEAMGIPVLAGRTFTDAEARDGRVMVVNETMARRYWPEGGALGKHVLWAPDEPPVEVIGVVRDAKYRSLRESADASFYVPPSLFPFRDGSFHVRMSSSPSARLDELRQAVVQADPRVPVQSALALRDQANRNIADDRLAMTIGVTLAVAAVLLAAAGLFGSMSYLVTQRTREIGVRVALGADAHAVHTLVLSQGLRLALVGSAIGLMGAVWTSRAIEARLFGVTAQDPVSFLSATLVLTAVALLATWLPARRAARVDPIHALRDE